MGYIKKTYKVKPKNIEKLKLYLHKVSKNNNQQKS